MEMTLFDAAAALIGAVGGLEFIKWLFGRKSAKRNDEMHFLKETMEFLQQQLDTKEKRFAEQTDLVRQLNRDAIALERKNGRLEVELAEVRCEDKPCPYRLPPNAYTQARSGATTKEEYFERRKRNRNENTDRQRTRRRDAGEAKPRPEFERVEVGEGDGAEAVEGADDERC